MKFFKYKLFIIIIRNSITKTNQDWSKHDYESKFGIKHEIHEIQMIRETCRKRPIGIKEIESMVKRT